MAIKKLTYTGESKPIKRIVEAINSLIDSGGRSGSTVVVTPTLSSGTKIAEISVDEVTKNLYAPSGSGGSGGIALPAFTGNAKWNGGDQTDHTFTVDLTYDDVTLVLLVTTRPGTVTGLDGWTKLAEAVDSQSYSGITQTITAHSRRYTGGGQITIPLKVTSGYYCRWCVMEFVNVSAITARDVQSNVKATSTSNGMSFSRKMSPIQIYGIQSIYFGSSTYEWTVVNAAQNASVNSAYLHKFPDPSEQKNGSSQYFLDLRGNGAALKMYSSGASYAGGFSLAIT